MVEAEFLGGPNDGGKFDIDRDSWEILIGRITEVDVGDGKTVRTGGKLPIEIDGTYYMAEERNGRAVLRINMSCS